MENYETVTEAINALRKQGYTEDLNLLEDSLGTKSNNRIFHDEFKIDKFFRFEGNTDPGDESILYAISSEKHNLKGILLNGYGASTESMADALLEKLKV